LAFDKASGGTYFQAQNISNILVDTAEIGILSMGILVVLLLGEIDLSIASIAALSGVCAALVMQGGIGHLPDRVYVVSDAFHDKLVGGLSYLWLGSTAPDLVTALIGIVVALVVGLAVGTLQGAWVAYLKVPSFVVTLAGLLAYQGAALIVSSAATTPITSDYFNAMGATSNQALDTFPVGSVSFLRFSLDSASE
jgi:ABC-type xylose transport system permease subunit